MRIAVSGASGMVGRALCRALGEAGHHVVPMVRGSAGGGEIAWDPAAGELEPAQLRGLDGVVHLAGESIAAGRWTAERKQRIRDSRVDGTRLLAEALAGLEAPPPVLVCASAIGFYGDRGDELVDEDSSPGEGFLAQVCVAWEGAADAARERGLRVVHLRFGMVLSRGGGALAKMATPFRLGVGGPVGSGRQWQSWIHLDDAVGLLQHALAGDVHGPLNAVAPEPVRQVDLARTLGRVLNRPAVMPLPAPVVGLVFGEMGRELLLASTRVSSKRAVAAGYGFRFPRLRDALERELGT